MPHYRQSRCLGEDVRKLADNWRPAPQAGSFCGHGGAGAVVFLLPADEGEKVRLRGGAALARQPKLGRSRARRRREVRLRARGATARQPSRADDSLVYRAEARRSRAKAGGPDRDRTGDLLNAIQARSQLRYRPSTQQPCEYSRDPRNPSKAGTSGRAHRPVRSTRAPAARHRLPVAGSGESRPARSGTSRSPRASPPRGSRRRPSGAACSRPPAPVGPTARR